MQGTRRYVVPLTAMALAICYASTLRGMVEQWAQDEDMAHGFVVPLVIFWVVWRERDRWRPLPRKASLWGYAILAVAAGLDFAGALGVGLFARSLAFLLSVAGAILCLGGFAWLRVWTFPFVLALFMLPKLAIVYNQVTLPLQLLATRLAATMLTVAGFAVIRSGNILNVAGHRIAVVEACDGIRYLIPLVFTALVLGYLAGSKLWMRVALAFAAGPVAILANGIRVAAAAPIPALATGPMHSLAGWLIFLLCLITLALVHRLIQAVYARYAA
jgi:exosortase